MLAKCHEVIKILSPDIAKSIDEETVLGKPLELSIKPEVITDCNHSLSKLFPRFHLDALNYLIKEGKVFTNDSLPKVELIKSSLQKKLEETREKKFKKKASKIKKKKLHRNRLQFYCFSKKFYKKGA